MGKVHPSSLASTSQQQLSSDKLVFTVWMKSLIFHGKGCTVFDSDGRIVYRVDNYDRKGREEVYVMDHSGKYLFMIHKRKLSMHGSWEGYKCTGSRKEALRPCFKFRMPSNFLKGQHSSCDVSDENGQLISYTIEGLASKSSYKVFDISGKLVAEVNRKQTASGVVLGDDVLTLMVEPNIDQSVMMGMVVVHGLINHSM